ncbi:hypothetical protein M404DRAFT_36728 [Pisolithus tinctorius Marx 270]|uniref:Uncharacterized protein n=1 Tax=Pisolithus tinctorius Marx 270 TaxID=870435 RepID=A0A0C3NB25_PISTI|nr:hypothetical protein M404DRAFT_36728 [Pisolithus tinctorius Marx 270]
MAKIKKQFKKPLFRTRKPANCSLPAGSSQALGGDLASDSQSLGNGSRGTLDRIKDFLHPSWVTPVKGCQGPTAERDHDPLSVEMQVDAALLVMVPSHPRMGHTAVDYVAKVNTSVVDIQNPSNTHLHPFKIFNSVVVSIANVHPYAQMALGILTAASQV